MKVVHIMTTDAGGAGHAACRLHAGLLKLGVESSVLCRKQTSSGAGIVCDGLPPLRRQIMRLLRCRGTKPAMRAFAAGVSQPYELFTPPLSEFSPENHELVRRADIVHLHWVADYVNYPTFFTRVKKPVVWTLHDMNPFLGGFHYASDETRIRHPLDQRFKALKTRLLQAAPDLTVVSPSQWLADCSAASDAFKGRPHHAIPNGIDLHAFAPVPRDEARRQFGIPPGGRVLLFIAHPGPNAHRKGMDLLATAAPHFHAMGFHVCGIGSFGSPHIREIPPMYETSRLAALYSAADFLILPSREDNLPNTMLEAMACGTPVIATPAGGMKEFVRDAENGVLAGGFTPEALIHAVRRASAVPGGFDRAAVRKFAKTHFAQENAARQYAALYNSLMERTHDA